MRLASSLSRPAAFIWKVGVGTLNCLQAPLRSRPLVAVMAPIGLLGSAGFITAGLASPSAISMTAQITFGLTCGLGWVSAWLKPFRGAPWQQFIPPVLSQSGQIMRACRRGDLVALQGLRLPAPPPIPSANSPFNFAFAGKYDRATNKFPLITPLSEAITHHHWDVVQWLLLEQNLLLSPSFLGVLATPALRARPGSRSAKGTRRDIPSLYACLFPPQQFKNSPPDPASSPAYIRPLTLWERYLAAAPTRAVAQTILFLDHYLTTHLAALPPSLSTSSSSQSDFASLFLFSTLVKRAYLNPEPAAMADLARAILLQLPDPFRIASETKYYLALLEPLEQTPLVQLAHTAKATLCRSQLDCQLPPPVASSSTSPASRL